MKTIAIHTGQTLLLIVCAATVAGCLGEPKIEDSWTRLDIQSENLTQRSPLTPGAVCSVSVRATITYRSVITGIAVTELRAGTGVTSAGTVMGLNAPRLDMAQSIDFLLANSVSVGRATRAVTGWDHLIQQIDFNFSASVPSVLDSSAGPPGTAINLFLVTYLGEGEEIELADGSDSLVVTPFISADREVLPIGLPIAVSSAGGP